MPTTSRRGFLKGLGATLAVAGVTAAGATAAPVAATTGAGGAAGSALTHAANTQRMGRTIITQAELAMLVTEHLNERIVQMQSFTAYDVTRALRLAHPSVEIMHPEVRDIVHRRMRSLVAAQFYRQALVQFPSGSACCYVPRA